MYLHPNNNLTLNFRKITRKPISARSFPNERKIRNCKTHLSTLIQSTHSLCHSPPVVASCHLSTSFTGAYRPREYMTLQLSWSETGSEIDFIDILFPELETPAPPSSKAAPLVLLFPVHCDTHEIFYRLQSNVLNAPILFQINRVVH